MLDTDTASKEFVRPAKSPARRTGGSGGESVEASVRQMAGQAYQSVPDMGVTSTLQSAYAQAPDMGVQSTFTKVTGYGGGNAQQQGNGDDRTTATGTNRQSEPDSASSNDNTLSPREISKQKGPSSQERIGKSQQDIGTEDGVPTRAGLGSTLSPDQTNANAAQSSSHQPKRAAVPEDYAPEPLPDGSNNASDRTRTTTTATAASGTSSPRSNVSSSERKRRSFGEKLRDQVRGEIKIMAGSLTNNEAKITQGLNIKHGEAA